MGSAPTPRKARGAATRAGAPAARPASVGKGTAAAKGRTAAKPALKATARARLHWSWPVWRLGAMLRRDIAAIALAVLATLTIWSLLIEHGGLLGLWSAALRRAFGWAAILAPLALLAWVFDLFRPETADDGALITPRQRHLLGISLLLLAILGLLHLPAPDYGARDLATTPESALWWQAGKGGGFLGYFIAAPLVAALRPVGAAVVLLGLALVGIIIALETDLRSLWRSLARGGAALLHTLSPTGRPGRAALALPGRPVAISPVELPITADEPDDAPIINLPQPAPRPVVEVIARPSKRPRPALDEPVPPLVVGSGQLPLPAEVMPPAPPSAALTPRFEFPPVEALPLYESVMPNQDELSRKAKRIEETLAAFKVEARVREINPGAAVTQFALEPGAGVKVRSIKVLENDLALALAASSIAIETPIPGQPRVGIVIPNKNIAIVGLRETMESKDFVGSKAKLPIALGRDVNGRYIVADLAKMPHLLIAGSTGAGKSVCLNTIITTFLLTRGPDEVKLVMVDPKMVELVGYNGVPHLKSPVVIEMDKVVGTLRKALSEMERRYQIFSKLTVRNIDGYRERRELDPTLENLPYLVVIIDELADLMMTAPDEVEGVIVRLAQMARATGIHLIIATQRPSVDVLTGLIKANFPARIAFMVTSQIDSRVILDMPGAERLLGKGDMLFQAPDAAKPVRVQGTFVHDRDIERIVSHWRQAVPEPQYEPDWTNVPAYRPGESDDDDGEDPLMKQALAVVEEHGTVSTSMLQRKLRIGFNRAARLVEQMEEEGIIGPSEGARGRTVLGTRAKNPADPHGDAPPWDEE